jgi:hypothetical protein
MITVVDQGCVHLTAALKTELFALLSLTTGRMSAWAVVHERWYTLTNKPIWQAVAAAFSLLCGKEAPEQLSFMDAASDEILKIGQAQRRSINRITAPQEEQDLGESMIIDDQNGFMPIVGEVFYNFTEVVASQVNVTQVAEAMTDAWTSKWSFGFWLLCYLICIRFFVYVVGFILAVVKDYANVFWGAVTGLGGMLATCFRWLMLVRDAKVLEKDDIQFVFAPEEPPMRVMQLKSVADIVGEVAVQGSVPVPVEAPACVATFLYFDPDTQKFLSMGGLTYVKVETSTGMKMYLMTAVHVPDEFGFSCRNYWAGRLVGSKWVVSSLTESKIAWMTARNSGDVLLIEPPARLAGDLQLSPVSIRVPRIHQVVSIYYHNGGCMVRAMGTVAKARAGLCLKNGLETTTTTVKGASGAGLFQTIGGKMYVVAVHRGNVRDTQVNIAHAVPQLAGLPRLKHEVSSSTETYNSDDESAIYSDEALRERNDRSWDEQNFTYRIGFSSDEEDIYEQLRYTRSLIANAQGKYDLGAERGVGQFDTDSESGVEPIQGHPTQGFQKDREAPVRQSTPLSSERSIMEKPQGDSVQSANSNVEIPRLSLTTDLGLSQSDDSSHSGPKRLLEERTELLRRCESLQQQLEAHKAEKLRREVKEEAERVKNLERLKEATALVQETNKERKAQNVAHSQEVVKLQRELKALRGKKHAGKKTPTPPVANVTDAQVQQALSAMLSKQSQASAPPQGDPQKNT